MAGAQGSDWGLAETGGPPQAGSHTSEYHELILLKGAAAPPVAFRAPLLGVAAVAVVSAACGVLAFRGTAGRRAFRAEDLVALDGEFTVGSLFYSPGDGRKCLAVSPEAPRHGLLQMHLLECNEMHDEMRFIFPKASGLIRWAASPSDCVVPESGDFAEGAHLVLGLCDEQLEAMHWEVPQGVGPLRMRNNARRCMFADHAGDGVAVSLGSCPAVDEVASQLVWVVQDAGLAQTLYCWALVRDGRGPEVQMLAYQQKHGYGVFACEGHDVFSTKGGQLMGVDTEALGEDESHVCVWGPATYDCNTKIFIRAWEHIAKTKAYDTFAWTVKVDPGAAFFPSRLRQRLNSWDHTKAVFLQNNVNFPRMLGHLEVASHHAVALFVKGRHLCYQQLDENQTQEDGYFSDCFEQVLHVRAMPDFGLLMSVHEGTCDGQAVCYHGFESEEAMQACFATAVAL